MRIHINDLTLDNPLVLSLHGGEDWLKDIYACFPSPQGQIESLLKAELEILRHDNDMVQVRGQYSFTPYLACGRCSLAIAWPISETIDRWFYKEMPPSFEASERDLTASELEESFLDEGFLDLEAVINEAVQLALPLSPTPSPTAAGECSVCLSDITDLQVYTTGHQAGTKEDHPFAKLRNLKLND